MSFQNLMMNAEVVDGFIVVFTQNSATNGYGSPTLNLRRFSRFSRNSAVLVRNEHKHYDAYRFSDTEEFHERVPLNSEVLECAVNELRSFLKDPELPARNRRGGQ